MPNGSTNIESKKYTREDIEQNKTMAGLSYLIFFLPLIISPESEYGKFHANQSLILWIVGIAGNLILGFIPFFGRILLGLLNIAVIVLGIIGMVNGFKGKVEELPLIGQYRIIK